MSHNTDTYYTYYGANPMLESCLLYSMKFLTHSVTLPISARYGNFEYLTILCLLYASPSHRKNSHPALHTAAVSIVIMLFLLYMYKCYVKSSRRTVQGVDELSRRRTVSLAKCSLKVTTTTILSSTIYHVYAPTKLQLSLCTTLLADVDNEERP